MTRLQKKCLVCSLGLHGLLAGIVFLSAAFRTRPEESELQVLSMIPANLLDRAGAGGGTPAASAAPPQPLPLAPQPLPPQLQAVTRVETPSPKAQPRELPPTPRPKHIDPPTPEREPDETPHESAIALEQRPPKPHHEIHVSYEPASNITKTKKTKENAQAEQAAAAAASAAAERRRLRHVEESLSQLASGVESSSAEKTTVEVPGIGGGGEVFAGYNDAVYNIYYHAWVAPDSVPDRLTVPVIRVVVTRDGSIISAELIAPSGEAVLDKSVERALRAVKSLPAFPAGAREGQRVFQIKFSLDAKKASG